MNFSEVCRAIERRASLDRLRNGCEETRKALNALKFNDSIFFKQNAGSKTIVVAGTNGKGSAAASLAHLLSSKGFRVGLFTSPHLISVCERIQINGISISEQHFIETYNKVSALTDNHFLTRFEILTVMAVHYFTSNQLVSAVDYMIFEVGIGGLRDATNAIPHDWVILTTISYDHTELLGESLNEILLQKLGVVDDTNVKSVVFRRLSEDLEKTRTQYEAHTQANWVEVSSPKMKVYQQSRLPKFFFEWNTQWVQLSLAGQRGGDAAALALTMYQQLGFDPTTALNEINNIKWPGRMEYFKIQNKSVFLSGDHNVEGVDSLISLLDFYKRERIVFLVGIGVGKNANEILTKLKEIPRVQIVLTKTPYKSRTESPDKSLQYIEEIEEAFKYCLDQTNEEDILIVTGSLYLVGEVRSYILRMELK